MLALLLSLFLVCVILRARRTKDEDEEEEQEEEEKDFGTFRLEELIKATDNFNKKNVVGNSGKLYKGRLSQNRKVIIKKYWTHEEGLMEMFIAELDALTPISHPNLVQLLGYCQSRKHSYLVFEFISNKNLHQLLHDNNTSIATPWVVRHQIAIKVAEGLNHLHSFGVLHRDFKGEKVLLDAQLEPKTIGFGVDPNRKGSFGYICPQFCVDCHFTPACDIFSFAVLLGEMLTGSPALFQKDGIRVNLAVRFREEFDHGNIDKMFDPKLADADEATKGVMRSVAAMVRQCLCPTSDNRPPLADVLEQLRNFGTNLPEEKDPIATTSEASAMLLH